MLKPIAIATAIAGTLDILFAVILTLLYGGEPANMLRFVASGPFPGAKDWGAAGAMLGLLVHFSLMAIMATIYIFATKRLADLIRRPLLWGILYGLATQIVMNFVVVQLRFHPAFPPKPLTLATQLFAHIVLVGIPIALTASFMLRPSVGGARPATASA